MILFSIEKNRKDRVTVAADSCRDTNRNIQIANTMEPIQQNVIQDIYTWIWTLLQDGNFPAQENKWVVSYKIWLDQQDYNDLLEDAQKMRLKMFLLLSLQWFLVAMLIVIIVVVA